MTKQQFIALVTDEQESLRRFLLALCCGNRDESEDIAQDSLIKAYLSLDKYTEQCKFSAWLFKIAYRTFFDYKRKDTRQVISLDAADGAAQQLMAESAADYQELYIALDALPSKERYAILLFYMQGYSIREISQITDCSEDAVKKQLSRGRDQLKNKIQR